MRKEHKDKAKELLISEIRRNLTPNEEVNLETDALLLARVAIQILGDHEDRLKKLENGKSK